MTKIAALADIHVGQSIHPYKYEETFASIGKEADVFVMCGDLTDHGTAQEAEQLTLYLKSCPIPKIAVLGNHDFSQEHEMEIHKILTDSGVIILNENVYEYNDIGFAGVKGFGGGFGKHMLSGFGESTIKQFVQEAIGEAEQLEISLDYIGRCSKKVVLLHYAPIPQTNKGEPLEIYPFLGSSRFEEVIDRHDVTTVFHGHAHFGSHSGHTLKGIPVFNVAWPIMAKINPKRPYLLFEI